MLSFNINTPILSMIPGLLFLALATSCIDSHTSGSDDAWATTDDDNELFETSDLSLFELRHRVKRVTTTTFYNVTPGPDSVAIDTTAVKPLVTTVYFDQLGHYVPRRDERVKRDEWGTYHPLGGPPSQPAPSPWRFSERHAHLPPRFAQRCTHLGHGRLCRDRL